MKKCDKNETAIIEQTHHSSGIVRYWVTVSSCLKKMIARYGPFDSLSEATLYAQEHHITLTQPKELINFEQYKP